MKFIDVQPGTQPATVLPDNSDGFAADRIRVESLADLCSYLNGHPTSQTPMLRSTAGKIAAFLGKATNEISLDLIHATRENFRPYLESHHYKNASVRSYVNYLRILLDEAEKLGWKPFAAASPEWQALLDRAKGKPCLVAFKALAQTKNSPAEITEEDLDRWIRQRVQRGTRYSTARSQVNSAWHTLVDSGYVRNAPFIFLRKKNYGVALVDFPERLKTEVTELLRWKSARFEPDRPQNEQIREVSAQRIQGMFSCIYGYATKIAKIGEIGSLEELIQKPTVSAFVAWCLNEQRVKGGPLVSGLGSVLGAVSNHPAHKALDLSWFRPLLDAVPEDSYEAVEARKARKIIDYAVLESIPAKMRAARDLQAKRGKQAVARLSMEELMISWLLVFPWRQRNIRECRIAGPDPNLFKAKLPVFSYIDKPDWVVQEETQKPTAEFWQVKFSPEETKTKEPVHCVVPRMLVGVLEEFLFEHRPYLLKGRSCDTLFVCPKADEATTKFVDDIVSDVTLRFGGRRVNPHLFRDIVAFAWLKAHPKDFLTLSKMLWHRNVQTTIYYYGGKFNASSATVAMEAWVDERKAKSK